MNPPPFPFFVFFLFAPLPPSPAPPSPVLRFVQREMKVKVVGRERSSVERGHRRVSDLTWSQITQRERAKTGSDAVFGASVSPDRVATPR